MLVAIIFAHLWGVIELAALGSLARTTRLRTLVAAMAAGFYACAAITLVLQIIWTRAAAWLTGASLSEVVRVASYTLDPFIEEGVKVLPLVALLTVDLVKRQWSLTDCVLVGAATGSGFGLAENLLRYGSSAGRAVAVDGGWLAERSLAFPVVPSPWTAMTSWLPEGVAYRPFFAFGPAQDLSLHLVWSAIGGLAVGLMMLRGGRSHRWLGTLLLVYVGGEHAVYNAGGPRGLSLAGVISAPFNATRPLLWLMPLAALAVAWNLDRRRLAVSGTDMALQAERATSPPLRGTIQTALAKLPWSLLWVDGLVRLRRACVLEQSSQSEEPRTLPGVVIDLRDRIERVVAAPDRLPVVPAAWTPATLRQALRQPAVIAWIVLVTPSVLWFVVGGLPQTAWVQAALASAPAWAGIRLLSALALAWMAWQIVAALRRWRYVARLGVGDIVAAFALRLVAGAGAVALGGYMFMLAVTGNGPTARLIDNVHLLEAFERGVALAGLLMPLLALLMFPPGAGAAWALAGGRVLGGALSRNLIAHLVGILGLAGVMLMAAGQGTGAGEPPAGEPPGAEPPPKKPTLQSNPKHHPQARGRASPEPADAADVYNNAIEGPNGSWYGKNAQGDIYRYSQPSNGVTHWNGSTSGPNGIPANQIPVAVRRALGVLLK